MKFLALLVLILTASVFALACSGESNSSSTTAPADGSSPAPSATTTPDEFASTRVIFKEHCAKCHGDNAEGGSVTVDGKKLKVPSFKGAHALKHTDEDFEDQIVNGGDGMPKFKDKLKPQEVTELIRFVRKEFQGK